VAKEKKDLDFVTFEFLGQCDLLQAKKNYLQNLPGLLVLSFLGIHSLETKKPVSNDSQTIHNNILDSNEAIKLAPQPKAQNPSKYLCKAATELSAKIWVGVLAIKDVAAMLRRVHDCR
jgi:hypothetical protein